MKKTRTRKTIFSIIGVVTYVVTMTFFIIYDIIKSNGIGRAEAYFFAGVILSIVLGIRYLFFILRKWRMPNKDEENEIMFNLVNHWKKEQSALGTTNMKYENLF